MERENGLERDLEENVCVYTYVENEREEETGMGLRIWREIEIKSGILQIQGVRVRVRVRES